MSAAASPDLVARQKILAAAGVVHDEECVPCPHDRKYVHCCANFVNAILRVGPEIARQQQGDARGITRGA